MAKKGIRVSTARLALMFQGNTRQVRKGFKIAARQSKKAGKNSSNTEACIARSIRQILLALRGELYLTTIFLLLFFRKTKYVRTYYP